MFSSQQLLINSLERLSSKEEDEKDPLELIVVGLMSSLIDTVGTGGPDEQTQFNRVGVRDYVVKEYQARVRSLRDEALPLNKRAWLAIRTLQEATNWVGDHTPPHERRDFLVMKQEVQTACRAAMDILTRRNRR